MSMPVFISWSKQRSRALGECLNNYIPLILQRVKPFFSPTDIAAGTQWAPTILSKLEGPGFLISCVTAENQGTAWLNFEAGAGANAWTKARVCPVLLGLDEAQLSPPL